MIFFVGAYIFIFNLIFIKSETYSSVLVNGIKNYFHDIKPRDINIYHYNSSSLQVDFFLEKIKGSPLMYSYLSNDANHYLPTEDELIYLSIGEATEKAKSIDTTMILKLNLLFQNNITEDNQYVIIVYCSQTESCDYSILFQDFHQDIRLEENEPFYLPLFKGYTQKFSINQEVIPEKKPLPILKIVNTLITGSGNIFVTQNDGQKSVKGGYGYGYASNLNIIYYTLNETYNPQHKITITLSCQITSVSSIYYTWVDSIEDDITKEVSLKRTIVEIHEIRKNNNITFYLDNVFSQNEFTLTYLKSQNCFIDITADNDVALGVDFFYKNYPKGETSKNITVSINDNKSQHLQENDFCILYTYSISPSDYQYNLLLQEKIPITFILNNEFSRIVLTNPFFFSDIVEPFLQVKIEIPENTSIGIKIIYNGVIPANLEYTIIDISQTIYLGEQYQLYCIEKTICNINIEIITMNSEKEFPVTITLTNGDALMYIKKNEMIMLQEGKSFNNVFYTDVQPGQKIKLIQDSKHYEGTLDGKLWQKTKVSGGENDYYNKRFFPSGYKANSYFNEVIITIPLNANCIFGCELLFQDSHRTIENGVIMKRNIAIYDYKEPIKSQLDVKINGHFEDKDTKIAHKFTLPLNIKKFMIVIEGDNILFNITANPSSSCILDSSYKATSGTLFIEKEILIDNSEINVEILIEMSTINSDEFNELESFYEIKVIPYVHLLNKPIFFINDIKQLETFTGEKDNTIYLVYEKDEPLEAYNTLLYVSPSKVFNVDITIQYCVYPKNQIITPLWDDYFNYNDCKSIHQNYFEFSFTNSQLIKYYFIKIVTEKTNQYLNVYFSRIRNDWAKKFYVFDKKPSLYYSGNALRPQASPLSTNCEVIFEPINKEKLIITNEKKAVSNILLDGHYSYLVDKIPSFNISKQDGQANFDVKGIAVLASRKNTPKNKPLIMKLPLFKKNKIRIPADQIKFPFIFEFDIEPDYPDVMINVKITRANIHLSDVYNLLNLTFKGSYVYNKEEDNENQPTIVLKPIESIAIFNFKNKNHKIYNKIRIQISQISENYTKTNNNTLNNLQFEILSSSTSKDHLVPLLQNNYFYSYFDNDLKDATYYIENSIVNNQNGTIRVELGICDNNNFIITFNDLNGTVISPNEIDELIDNGKHTYTFSSGSCYIQMNISLNKTKTFTDKVFYLVKNSVKEQSLSFNEYYIEGNVDSVLQDAYDIRSTWNNKIVGDIDAIYYYLLYPANLNYEMSICMSSESTFSELTNKTELLWNNTKKEYFEFTNEVVIFFEDDEGQHLFAYKTINITAYKFQIWIIFVVLIFVGIFGLIGIATFFIYRKIQIKIKEDEDNENIEILNQAETDLFTQQY